jgi:Na+/proline symporter
MHLAAFGVLAVTIAVYELAVFRSSAERWQTKLADLSLLAIPFLPPVLIAVFFSPHSSASAAIKYRDIATRIAGFAVPILYDWRIDGACYLLMLGLFCGP